MIRVCAKGEVVRGIDIYHRDLIRDLTLLKPAINYAYLKAYENVADDKFQTRWKAFRELGIIRGAYDYFHPSRDPIAQAKAFLKIVGPMEPGDLPPALDWETTDGMPAEKDRDAGYAWLTYVENETKKTPVIYSSPYFLLALALDSRFARFPLWVANYGVRCPSVPEPFRSWAFWQGSDHGDVPGMIGHVDTDLFNGTLADLKKFIQKSNLGRA